MIVSNTTISRAPERCARNWRRRAADFPARRCSTLSTRMLAQTFLRVEGQFPLIGVGGIDSAEAALAKIEAGADAGAALFRACL